MNQATPTQPPAPKGRKIPWWWFLLGGFVAFTGFGMFLVEADKSNYKEGHAAYKKGDCDKAIESFNKVLDGKDANPKETREYVKGARKEKAECVAYKAAADKQKAGDPGATMLAYIEFAASSKDSELMSLAREQFKSLLDKNPPDKLATAKSCSRASELPKLDLVPEPEKNVPSLLLACGRQLEGTKDFPGAAEVYESFVKSYPQSAKLDEAKAGLARSLVADAKASGAGSLPSPQRSGSASGGSTVVIIKNSSPNRLRIALSGAESRVEELEPCEKCEKFTQSTLPKSCPKEGTVGQYKVKPGQYEVVVLSSDNSRVTPFKGTWQLSSGGEYSNCFYIVTRKQ